MSCYEIAPGVIACGPGEMREFSRESMGARWCFTHRKREEFFQVVREEVEPSYYGPTVSVDGPERDCSDLFPGWSREWEE